MKKVFLILFALAGMALAATAQESKTMYVMKNGEIAYQSAVSEVDSIVFYASVVLPDDEEGVVINGVKWATCNVDAPGTFAANPEAPGMFYQWNRKVGWSATDPMINSNGGTTWDSSLTFSSTWEKTNDPSPSGWRVPTLDEIKTLLDANKVSHDWVTQNGVNGQKFTDKATGNSLFLPAVGSRYFTSGGLYSTGEYGYYWSSTQDGTDGASYLLFNSSDADWTYHVRRMGFSVRSVAE